MKILALSCLYFSYKNGQEFCLLWDGNLQGSLVWQSDLFIFFGIVSVDCVSQRQTDHAFARGRWRSGCATGARQQDSNDPRFGMLINYILFRASNVKNWNLFQEAKNIHFREHMRILGRDLLFVVFYYQLLLIVCNPDSIPYLVFMKRKNIGIYLRWVECTLYMFVSRRPPRSLSTPPTCQSDWPSLSTSSHSIPSDSRCMSPMTLSSTGHTG